VNFAGCFVFFSPISNCDSGGCSGGGGGGGSGCGGGKAVADAACF